MEFAIVRTGGKQYSVSVGDKLSVDKLETVVGDKTVLSDVLLYSKDDNVIVGDSKVVVEATVLDQKREKKIIVFKKNRRQNYRRKNGFRRHVTVLRIDSILVK